MELYAGTDLHSRNNYIGIINGKDERIYSKRHGNRLPEVLTALRPFKRSLKGVVVESTYNWYWLVDGLQENGYRVHLANPSAISKTRYEIRLCRKTNSPKSRSAVINTADCFFDRASTSSSEIPGSISATYTTE